MAGSGLNGRSMLRFVIRPRQSRLAAAASGETRQMPLKVEVGDEAVRLLRARCLSQLHIFAVSECGFESASKRIRCRARKLLFDFLHDAIECVGKDRRGDHGLSD